MTLNSCYALRCIILVSHGMHQCTTKTSLKTNPYYSSRDVATAVYTQRHNPRRSRHISVQILGAEHMFGIPALYKTQVLKNILKIKRENPRAKENSLHSTVHNYVSKYYTAVSCDIAQDKRNRKSSLVVLRAFTAASDWQTGLLRLLCC